MKIKQKDKNKIIFMILFVLIISLFLAYKIISTLRYYKGNPKDILYVVSTTGNIDYKTYLKTNDFFDNSFLDQNFSYVTSLIDYINVKFNYEYKNNKLNLINQSSKIEAKVVVKNLGKESEKNLWNKIFILKETNIKERLSTPVTSSEEINIDLNYYNVLVNNFINFIKFEVDAYLEVKLTLNFSDISNLKNNNEYYMSLIIPLNKNSFDVLVSNNFSEEQVIYSKAQEETKIIYVKAIIYLIILIILNILNVYVIKNVILKNYSKYTKAKGKILKEFNDKIVTVTNFIKLDNYQIVNVEEFEELVDLSNEAFEPIFFFEKKNNYSKEAWFCILKEKIVYKYTIYSKQFKNKK